VVRSGNPWARAALSALFLPAALLAGEPAESPAAPAAADPAPRTGMLQFLDGSILHGALRSMNVENGLRWEHPAALKPMEFTPSNIASIRFDQPQSVAELDRPSCRFRFNNDDELFGNLVAMEDGTLEIQTWFGDSLKASRQALQSISFLSKGYGLHFEGPTGTEGWNLGRGPNFWHYRDGAFFVNAPAVLGRDMKLPDSASLEFELSWTGNFNLILMLYSEVLDRFDYTSSSYMFYIGPGHINAQRIHAGAGMLSLGQVTIPEGQRKSKMRIEIRASKEDATLAVLIDGQLRHRWKDNAGFVARGSGVVFHSQISGPTVRLSNIKVSDWDGKFESETNATARPGEDIVAMINRDKVHGKVEGLSQGKLKVVAEGTALDIPLQRISQIVFAPEEAPPPRETPWEVRALFSGGGAVSFQLDEWQAGKVSGRNSNFGLLTFQPNYIREIQFNLDRQKASEEDGAAMKDIWDFNE
jgi:hypothetical protein